MSAASVTAFPRRTPPTILVVEDDVLSRCRVSDELRAQGFKVLEAHSAEDAITVLDSVRVDLLLAATGLPGPQTGLDVIRHAQARSSPTLAILATDPQDGSIQAAPDGIDHVVRKPYDLPKVVELVSSILRWPAGAGA